MKLHELCSPFLKSYLQQAFGNIDLSETKATCDDCLCSKPSRGNLPYYRSDLKCCTFHPFLPNYAVGALLEDPKTDTTIKAILRNKIQQREYTLPLGIFAPIPYQVKFNHRHEGDFGNQAEFLCPYFNHQNKNCGIWQHRGSVCTSYYCISDRGKKGLKTWELIGDYLHVCEMVLSQDALVSMGLSPDIIEGQLEYVNCTSATPEELASSSMSPALFLEYWQHWVDQDTIENFYISCSRYIGQLSPHQIQSLVSEETALLEAKIKKQLL
jgi:Fe-S-cluster containining protein